MIDFLNLIIFLGSISASGAAAIPSCPPGWHTYDEYTCFSLNLAGRAYEDAATDCINQGATIASIHSIEEHQFVSNLLNSAYTYWIGLADGVSEGTFKWADGTPLDFTFYDRGQPDNDDIGPGEDCVFMSRIADDRRWKDSTCTKTYSYICRMNLANDTELPEWRNDNKCGPDYIAPNGHEAVCPLACCSYHDYCGTETHHCEYTLYKDYRKCPVLTKPDYITSWEEPDNSFGAVATFDCPPGYSNQGSASRTCQTNGTWSGKEAVCVHKGGIQIYLVEGDGTITRGEIFDELEVNRNVGEVTLACKFDSIQSEPPVFTANGQDYSMTETVAGLEWIVTVDLDKDDSYLCSTQDNELLLEVDVRVDAYLDLTQGQGVLTRHSDGNYDLRVLPGETITLVCAPEYVLGAYVWKLEPSREFYSSVDGVVPSGPLFDRYKFQPQPPSRWDEMWMMTIRDLEFEEELSFSCSSSSYGETAVNVTVQYDVTGTDALQIAFNGDGLSDEQTISITYVPSNDKGTETSRKNLWKKTTRRNDCNTDPSLGKWVSFGDHCYHVGTERLKFESAEAKCREIGSEISSIHSEAEQQFHKKLMMESAASNAWIGLTDRETEGSFFYIDGTPVDYTNWNPGEPNNSGGYENHVYLTGSSDYKWNDDRYDRENSYICKAVKGTDEDVPTTSAVPSQETPEEDCPSGWHRYQDSCYSVHSAAARHETAVRNCIHEGAQIASVHSMEEHQFLSGLLDENEYYWLGLKPWSSEWEDGSPFDFTWFESGYQNEEGCVVMPRTDDRKWKDYNCNYGYPHYICRKNLDGRDISYPGVAEISCTFNGENPGGALTWYKDDVELIPLDNRMQETVTGRLYKLNLGYLSLDDAGKYRCVAEDGRAGNLHLNLKVRVTMSFPSAQGKLTSGTNGASHVLAVFVGRNLTLTCRAKSMPVNPILKWQMSSGGDTFTDISESSGGKIVLKKDRDRKEWSLTLVEISKFEQGVYSCAMYDESGIHMLGKSKILITTVEAAAQGIDIALTTERDGVTTWLTRDQTSLKIDESIGRITFTCLSSFWAGHSQWGGYFWDDDYNQDHIIRNTIPGLETTKSTTYNGDKSDGEHYCSFYDYTTGRNEKRIFTIVNTIETMMHNVTYPDGRGQTIETSEKTIVTAFLGETVSFTCGLKDMNNDFTIPYRQYFYWKIGSTKLEKPRYARYDEAYNRFSFSDDEALKRSTLTLTDLKMEDEGVYGCQIDEGTPAVVHLVVFNASLSCEFECYPGTGAWDGNCVADNQTCNVEMDCPNRRDEADCPDLGCSGLSSPANGGIQATSFTFGSEVTFYCKPGYKLEGDETLRCQDNGEWNGDQPTCKLNVFEGCLQLGTPSNGFRHGFRHDVGDTYIFECANGFELQGSYSRTCLDNKTWSGEPTECVKLESEDNLNLVNLNPVVSLARGAGTTVNYLRNSGDPENAYNRTVITVDRNEGSITIACRLPTRSNPPYWIPERLGVEANVESVIGDYSISETVEGFEWSLTMGVSDDGPLGPGSQTEMECYANDPLSYNGRFRIDVAGDQPFADTNTTKVTITLSDGFGVEEIITQPDGSTMTNIQVNPMSTISITCNVTSPEAITSKFIGVIWERDGEWGDDDTGGTITSGSTKYSDDPRVSLQVDTINSDWTLTLREVTKQYSGLLLCVVIPDKLTMHRDNDAVVASVNLKVKEIPDYRDDKKCGPGNLALNREEAICPGECCSTDGLCGGSYEHCVTNLYKDYRVNVAITLSEGYGIEEMATRPDGSNITNIQVNPMSTVSITCNVSSPATISRYIEVIWERDGEWGEDYSGDTIITSGSTKYSDDPRVSLNVDTMNTDWTLTLSEVTNQYTGSLRCVVIPHVLVMSRDNGAIEAPVNLKVEHITDYRDDKKCGSDNLATNGEEAICPGECCSTDGLCGSSNEHCITKLYMDYRVKVAITLSEGYGIEEITTQPDGSNITNIQVNPMSTVSITCNVSSPAIISKYIEVIWERDGEWGEEKLKKGDTITSGSTKYSNDRRVSLNVDTINSDWTLTLSEVTDQYTGTLRCVVIPHVLVMSRDHGAIEAPVNLEVNQILDYREDNKCGPGNLAQNGEEAICPGKCCSTDLLCGSTYEHCVTNLYKDYRDVCKFDDLSSYHREGWTHEGNYCYYVGTDSTSFNYALYRCRDRGANLTSIHNEVEQQLHSRLLIEKDVQQAWIGLNDRDREGSFVYIDGSPVDFTYWASGEPTSDGEPDDTEVSSFVSDFVSPSREDCTQLTQDLNSKWEDVYCYNSIGYICKRQAVITDYRDDKKCGPGNLAPNGKEAICPGECCSTDGLCGVTNEHCFTKLYKDYRDPCSDDWANAGDFCFYVGTESVTFDTAEEKCLQLGASVSSIQSEAERQLIANLMTEEGINKAWIGLNDRDNEGTFVYTDGSPVDLTFWVSDEPNNANGNEDCTQTKAKNAKWNDVDCSETLAYTCKRPTDVVRRVITSPAVPEQAEVSFIDIPADQTIGRNQVASFPCKATGSPPPTIVWEKEGSQEMIFTGQQQGRLIVTSDGTLQIVDVQDEDAGHYICQAIGEEGVAKARAYLRVIHPCSTDQSSSEEWVNEGDFCYYMGTESVTFNIAEEKCLELGASVCSIHSEAERQLIANWMIEEGVKKAWIGLNDRDNEGSFVFTDGSPVDVTFWGSGEPNNANNNEDCTQTKAKTAKWNDVYCSETMAYICKKSSVDGIVLTTPAVTEPEKLPEPPACASDQFACESGAIACVPRAWVCDFQTECEDGSDERDCSVENVVPPTTSANQSTTDDVTITLSEGQGVENVIVLPGIGTFKNILVTKGDRIALTCKVSIDGAQNVVWTQENNPISYGGLLVATSGNVEIKEDLSKQEWTVAISEVSQSEEGQWICAYQAADGGLTAAIVNLTTTDTDPNGGNCPEGYTGPSCECLKSLDSCRSPDGSICNNAGLCICGTCICNDTYRGVTCFECPDCPGECEVHKPCVQCKAFKSGEYAGEPECDECPYPIMVVEELQRKPGSNECLFKDDDDCVFVFTHERLPDGTFLIEVTEDKACPPDQMRDVEITLSEGQGVENVIVLPGIGTFKNILVTKGDRIALTCKVSIDGAQNVVWTQENTPISYGGLLVATSGNVQIKEDLSKQEWTVTISEVSQSEEGQWICAYQSADGGFASAIVNLTTSDISVDGVPTTPAVSVPEIPQEQEGLYLTPSDPIIIRNVGDNVVFSCTNTDATSTIPTWTDTNGNVIMTLDSGGSADLHVEILVPEKISKLYILNIIQSYVGVYGCRVGQSFASRTLALFEAIKFPMKCPSGDTCTPEYEDEQEINIHESGRIECTVTGNPEPTIQWYFRSNLISSSDPRYTRTSVQKGNAIQHILAIGNVTQYDEGIYKCQAVQPDYGTLDRLDITVDVQGADGVPITPAVPVSEILPEEDVEITLTEGQGVENVIVLPGIGTFKNILVTKGDRIALTCKVSIDGAQNVVWTQENTPISYGGLLVATSGNIQIKEDLSNQEWKVTISEVSQSEEGQWICAYQTADGGFASAIVNLTTSDISVENLIPPSTSASLTDGLDGRVSTTPAPPATEIPEQVRTCEQISADNLNICSDLTYDETTMPNMFGHKTQVEVAVAIGAILQAIPDGQCPIQELACSTLLPPCKDSESISAPVPPCRWICEEAAALCASVIPWPPVPELDCNRFPDNDASYSRCWEPTNSIFGENLPCEKVPSPLCRNLGFRHTKFPNALKHQTAEEAMTAFQDESIQKLIDAGCSDELAPFVCAAFFPSCDDNTVIPVCYEVCRRTWKSCKTAAEELGIEKNEAFDCGKRYPSFEETGVTCLLDITPPSEAPILSEIKRLPTTIEFTAGTDDTSIDVFEATAYAVNVPESYPSSASTVNARTSSVGSKMSAKVIIGSSRNKRQAVSSGPLASSPLDRNTSYFVVVQSKNQYGYSDISAIILPKYNAESVDVPLDNEGGLAFFRMRNNPKQAICVNPLNESNPVWMDENGTNTQTEFMKSKTTNLISRMTVLELISEPIRGPYQCAKDLSSPGLITVDFKTTCFESEHFICKPFSSYLYLPNFFGHMDPQTAELASYEFLPLLQASCLNTTDLAQFVCAIYAPGGSCETSGSSEPPVAPCKEVCLKVQEDSRSCGEAIGFTWPRVASCEGLPSLKDGICADLGLLDGEIMTLTGMTPPPDVGKTVKKKTCSIKLRRYDIADLGNDCYFRGWADVQGQGASNDYCRVVSTGGQEFLSCALAGTEGESEYNFNSPNASDVWFDVGHKNTWYMRDEDGDDKDDYCRCVGEPPETYVSCMKSGDTGFIGQYDFTPSSAAPNCHATKINPFFGAP